MTEPARHPPRGRFTILDRPAPDRRRLLAGAGQLAGLWAIALVQPLLDLLGNNPDFFVARGNTPADILIFAFAFTVLPPLFLLLIEAVAARISPSLYHGLHFALLTLIVLFLATRLIGDLIPARSAVILLVSVALAAAFAFSVFRFTYIRNLADILVIAMPAVLLVFIFLSPVKGVIFPGKSEFSLARDSGTDHPIVLLLFDELPTAALMRDDRSIDAGRFPNFARLARDSTWYRNNSTTAFLTPMAVPQILTGIERPADTLPTWQDRPLSLFSQFARNRRLHVMEPVTSICPPELCPRAPAGTGTRLRALFDDLKYVEGRLVLPPGIAARLANVNTTFGGFGGDGDDGAVGGRHPRKTGELFAFAGDGSGRAGGTELVRTIPADPRGLTMLHFSAIPHQSWKLDVRGRPYNQSPIAELLADDGRNWAVNANGIATAQERMYTETGFADRLVGMMRQRLEHIGLWDRAIVIVTADHGISFKGGNVPQRRLSEEVIGEVANPPLFIKYPGQKRGRVSNRHSTGFDIVPTIARAVGVRDLYPTDGVPLQGSLPERPVRLVSPSGESVSATVGEMVRQRSEAIARARRRLGAGPFYTLGPASALIGRRVGPVPSGVAGTQLDDPDFWRDYRPGRGRIPMFVTGRTDLDVPADAAEGPVIAIAVNGVVRGTGRAFGFQGAARFGALVDPALLRPGFNRIGIYRQAGSRLVPLGGN